MGFEISSFKHIVVLTGAGVSAESGIGTFRDSGGLWERHRIEDVATPEAFARDPLLVWRFYSMRRRAAARADPNTAHLSLARLCNRANHGARTFTLVTQNVDALHERALHVLEPASAARAATCVLAMHGTLALSRCTACEMTYADPWAWFDDADRPASFRCDQLALPSASPLLEAAQVKRDGQGLPLSPCCRKPLRPHIVWFGETPLRMSEIMESIAGCDLFVTIGTSGQVYPAAGFIEEAKIAGAHTACLNKEPLPQHAVVDLYIEGPASQTVPEFFHALLS